MITQGLFSSNTPEWATPQDLYDRLNEKYHFNLDPCATKENAKCVKFYTLEDDGLKQNWGGRRVFCNPPYGREIGKWIRKCSEEAQKPGTIVVALLPARTDTRWFHEFIKDKTDVEFIRGRLKFGTSKNSAPFPSMIVKF